MFTFTTVNKCVCSIIQNILFLAFAVILEVSYGLYKITKHDSYDMQMTSKKYEPRSEHVRYARDRSPMSDHYALFNKPNYLH
jgi:hypothetical protein